MQPFFDRIVTRAATLQMKRELSNINLWQLRSACTRFCEEEEEKIGYGRLKDGERGSNATDARTRPTRERGVGSIVALGLQRGVGGGRRRDGRATSHVAIAVEARGRRLREHLVAAFCVWKNTRWHARRSLLPTPTVAELRLEGLVAIGAAERAARAEHDAACARVRQRRRRHRRRRHLVVVARRREGGDDARAAVAGRERVDGSEREIVARAAPTAAASAAPVDRVGVGEVRIGAPSRAQRQRPARRVAACTGASARRLVKRGDDLRAPRAAVARGAEA